MIKIAIYGKGGIGKSTMTSNLAAAFACLGKKVIQIGCDPKADSTINLLGGKPLMPVMDYLREKDEDPESIDQIAREGFGGVLCIETGGPTPGLGCAGRGIIATFSLLEDLRLFETYKPDVVLYDVLGDVVCGGFAAPIREGYAQKVLIVTSGEKMALYAANNIFTAVRNFEDRSYARVEGIILNSRNVEDENRKVEEFAASRGLPIVARIPRSDDIIRFEDQGMTVIEGDPHLEVSRRFLTLAENLLEQEKMKDLWEAGKERIPQDMISSTHLIYSSPATLAFNSPGAEGFGVKRAGLSVPDSVMLIVSPGCCGRNTSSISTMKGYENRFFYLTMDETDLVTGRHLRRIPAAVCELAEGLEKRPSVVMICITCVDALLGTDMERVCRKAEKLVNERVPAGQGKEGGKIRVRPCYMYALTREGRKPPMVHVRQSIYSLLEPVKKKADSVNIMGYFAPLDGESELRDLLLQIGVKTIREVSSCGNYGDFEKMAEANFNLVLNPEARPAASDLENRLGIPSIELTRLYQTDKIASQYVAFAESIGTKFDDSAYRETAEKAVRDFRDRYGKIRISVGEMMNGNAFELALALTKYGFEVPEIYSNVDSNDFVFIRRLAEISPDTRLFTNLSPTMMYYDCSKAETDLTIGVDAVYYHPDAPNVRWNEEGQPFGYNGVGELFRQMDKAMSGPEGGRK